MEADEKRALWSKAFGRNVVVVGGYVDVFYISSILYFQVVLKCFFLTKLNSISFHYN